MLGPSGYGALSPNSQDLLLRGALSGSSVEMAQNIAFTDLHNIPDVAALYQQSLMASATGPPPQIQLAIPHHVAPAPAVPQVVIQTRPRNGVPVNKLTVDLIRTYKQINQVRKK
jgi:hypothetical protein